MDETWINLGAQFVMWEMENERGGYVEWWENEWGKVKSIFVEYLMFVILNEW